MISRYRWVYITFRDICNNQWKDGYVCLLLVTQSAYSVHCNVIWIDMKDPKKGWMSEVPEDRTEEAAQWEECWANLHKALHKPAFHKPAMVTHACNPSTVHIRGQRLKVILGCMEHSRPAWDKWDPVSTKLVKINISFPSPLTFTCLFTDPCQPLGFRVN